MFFMKNIILILCLCSIFLTKGNGQNVTIFDTTNSNMTDPDLWSIAVDSRGNKWMGTSKNGLVKFDGKNVTPVFFREGKYKNVIMDIAIEDGTLWIATNFGLIRYIP